MHVTIIGTGNMARGIAACAVTGGHAVTLLGRSSAKAQALAGEFAEDILAGAVGDTLEGDLVVLALWYQDIDEFLAAHGEQLEGRIVVDIANPVDLQTYEPLEPEAGSSAQEVSRRVPGARVVKAFNTTFAGTLIDGRVAGQPLDVFLAADDEDAKALVGRLVADAGMRPLDAGPLARARQLEAVGYLHVAIQDELGTGHDSALKIVA